MTFNEWYDDYGAAVEPLTRASVLADLKACWEAAINSTETQEKPVAALLKKPIEDFNIKNIDIQL